MEVPITYTNKKGEVIKFKHTIDEFGVVRGATNKPLTTHKNRGRYRKEVQIYRKGRNYTLGVARLVASHFRSDIKGKIGFKDGDSKNCAADNLIDLGDKKSKIVRLKVIGKLKEAEIAREFNVSRQYVNQV